MMQFIIEQPNKRKYFCKDGKVIVFDSEQDAYTFAQNFYNFAQIEAMQLIFMEGPAVMQDVQDSMNKWKVIELPANFEPETINYYEFARK